MIENRNAIWKNTKKQVRLFYNNVKKDEIKY